MKTANYLVEARTEQYLLLRDMGPWDKYMTITNCAEAVLEELKDALCERRLFYYDSEGELTEILHNNGRFAGFKYAKELP